ncbi:putative transcription factor, K-box [Helianthus anomalus]
MNIMGESLGNMQAKDLKNLETKLEKGISRIRAKKVGLIKSHITFMIFYDLTSIFPTNPQDELLFAEIEHIQKRENELNNSNQFLRAKIAENQSAQQQHMSLMRGSSDYNLGQPHQPFDSRNYLQVNDLQPNNSYSCQDQTALQLV